MPQPLPDAVVATLKADPCAALAAILVISNAHSELLAWWQRALNGGKETIDRDAAGSNGPPDARKARQNGDRAGPNGASRGKLKPHKALKLNCGHVAYHARRRAQRDADDGRLTEAMGQTPGASIGALGRELGKSRGAIQAALHRLRDRGLADSDGEQWRLSAGRSLIAPQPPVKWVEPLSGAHVAKHTTAMRVPDKLMAASPQ